MSVWLEGYRVARRFRENAARITRVQVIMKVLHVRSEGYLFRYLAACNLLDSASFQTSQIENTPSSDQQPPYGRPAACGSGTFIANAVVNAAASVCVAMLQRAFEIEYDDFLVIVIAIFPVLTLPGVAFVVFLNFARTSIIVCQVLSIIVCQGPKWSRPVVVPTLLFTSCLAAAACPLLHCSRGDNVTFCSHLSIFHFQFIIPSGHSHKGIHHIFARLIFSSSGRKMSLWIYNFIFCLMFFAGAGARVEREKSSSSSLCAHNGQHLFRPAPLLGHSRHN